MRSYLAPGAAERGRRRGTIRGEGRGGTICAERARGRAGSRTCREAGGQTCRRAGPRTRRGAETGVYLCASPDVADITGGYFYDRKPLTPSASAQNAETAARLLHLKYVERDLPRSDEELREIIGSIVDEVVARRQEADRLQAASSVAPRPPTWVRNRRRAAILAAVLALVAIAAAVGLRPKNEIIPDELVGLWTTSQAGYTGRAFRITKESITFYTSPRDSTFHTLTRVRSGRARMARQFDLRYRGPDGRHDLSFYYLPADNVIQFRDQRGIVWVKARD